MRGILLSGAIAALLSFFGTPLFIKFLSNRGFGQFIRNDGPTTHQIDRKSTRLNSSHVKRSRMPSSA